MANTLTLDQPGYLRLKPGMAKAKGPRVDLVEGRDLDSALLECWQELQTSNPALASPCFSPGFAVAVANSRSDVEIAVVRQGREVRAIFPFQRKWGDRGEPLGGIVSDYQGLICQPDFECDPQELLRECGLISWDFDRLITGRTNFQPFYKLCEPSLLIALSHGYSAYAAERKAAGSRQIGRCENLMRRLEREIGPLRFVCHSSDPRALKKVLRWKSKQYKKSGWKDLFSLEWGRELVVRVHKTQTEDFAGMLSLLYAGNQLIAGHMGMRSRTVWHYWFPAYNQEFAKYSPGMILLLKMIQHAGTLGLQTIDLGTGSSLYKERLSNDSVLVAEGSVERPSWIWAVRGVRRRLRRLLPSRGTASFSAHR